MTFKVKFNLKSQFHYARGVGGGGELTLWESVGMRSGFAPHFQRFCPHFQLLDDLFASQILTMSTILFRSCWVPFQNPPFSVCRQSFCPPKLTKYIISFRSCWVPFWTSSGAPMLIFTRSAPPPSPHLQRKCTCLLDRVPVQVRELIYIDCFTVPTVSLAQSSARIVI